MSQMDLKMVMQIQTVVETGTDRERIKLTPTETVFNDDQIDLDFRVESDGNAKIFVEGTIEFIRW